MKTHTWTFTMACAVLLIAASSGSQAGKLRFYIDKNNNGAYDAGEAVPQNAVVDYVKKNSNSITATWTAADGTINYNGAQAGDTIYCKHLAYTQASPKGNHGTAGNMLELWMDTDSIGGTGNIVRRTLTAAEAQTVNNGGTANIRLNHPLFCWSLLVALNFPANADYLNKMHTGFKKASNYLYDVTDGQMKLHRIDIHSDVKQTEAIWADADICVFGGNQWPQSNVGCVEQNWGEVFFPKYFDGKNPGTGNPDKSEWYRTMVHELGHYILDFWDEYKDGNNSESAWTNYRFWHHGECTWNYGLMDSQYGGPEMSATNDYLGSYAGKAANQMTKHIWEYNRKNGNPHRPCWQHLFDRFDNSNSTQTLWNGYNGIRVVISMPPTGVYQGTDWLGNEQRSCSDRADPTSIQTTFGCFVEWTECEFPGALARTASATFDLDLKVIGPEGNPARGARVCLDKGDGRRIEAGCTDPSGSLACSGAEIGDTVCVSFDGRVIRTPVEGPQMTVNVQMPLSGPTASGPRLVIDPGLSLSGGNRMLRIRIFLSQSLIRPPTVYVRPGFGNPVPVTMTGAGLVWQGTVNIGQASEGGVDISATSATGTTETSTVFLIERVPAATAAMIRTIDGYLEANLPSDVLSSETLAVSMGSAGYPILPPDPSLIFVGEPTTFRLQDGAPSGVLYTLNYRRDRNSMIGRDANTLALYRFNTSVRVWEPVPLAVCRQGYRVISCENVESVPYAVLARESSDVQPPGTITDLTATTGGSGHSVILRWTAPGDDGSVGQTVRYHIYFNTEPITPGNLSECQELQTLDEPLPAGGYEEHAVEMPDPHKLYYLVVTAQDEAENMGGMSNVAAAVSYAQDTDGDGLSDQWEEAYGFDPEVPGEEVLDPDSDGLTNLQEYELNTNPLNPDTDADTLSDGLEVTAGTNPLDGTDPQTGSAASAKLRTDGTKFGCATLITYSTLGTGEVYACEPDRSSGIRLQGLTVPQDRLIEVIGTLATNADGERFLSGCVCKEKGPFALQPVTMTNRSLGGGDWFYDPYTGAGQKGVVGIGGLNNIGVYVEICGKVTYSTPAELYIDDGSALDDGSGHLGVKCFDPGVTLPVGIYVTVKGASSCYKIGNDLHCAIR